MLLTPICTPSDVLQLLLHVNDVVHLQRIVVFNKQVCAELKCASKSHYPKQLPLLPLDMKPDQLQELPVTDLSNPDAIWAAASLVYPQWLVLLKSPADVDRLLDFLSSQQLFQFANFVSYCNHIYAHIFSNNAHSCLFQALQIYNYRFREVRRSLPLDLTYFQVDDHKDASVIWRNVQAWYDGGIPGVEC